MWQAKRGAPLSEQSPLAQAAAIFTTSLVISWLLLVLLSFASVWIPLTTMLYLLMLGLFMAIISLGMFFVGAVPPAIMCHLILKQARPSHRAFRILVAVSDVFWIVTVFGLLIAMR